jgi:hypothetical protein
MVVRHFICRHPAAARHMRFTSRVGVDPEQLLSRQEKMLCELFLLLRSQPHLFLEAMDFRWQAAKFDRPHTRSNMSQVAINVANIGHRRLAVALDPGPSRSPLHRDSPRSPNRA